MSKIIRLTENQFGEMMAYHGSGSDFDKFNHKKYLSTGAGSQSFGWGTYVTSDETIGRSYSSIREEDVIEDYVYWLENGYDYWKIKNSKNKFKSEFIENHIKYFSDYFGQKDAYDAADFTFDILLSNKFSKSTSIMAVSGALKSCEDKVLYKGHGIKMTDEELDALSKKYMVIIGLLRRLNAKEPKKLLYQVDIPDDNGFNYLSWYDDLTNEQLDIIHSKMDEFSKRHNKVDFNNFTDHSQGFARPNGGNSVYVSLEYAFYIAGIDKQNTAKAASLFLMQCGFDGIKYPAGTRWQRPDGASEDAMNYVIFDANKVKIINKTKV